MSARGVEKYFFFTKKNVSTHWKDLAFCLGFAKQDIDNIDSKPGDDMSHCWDLLGEWQTRRGNEATIDVLMKALTDAELKNVVDGLKERFPELNEAPKTETRRRTGDTAEKDPTSEPKNLRPGDIQRALVCCQAVYEETPEAVQEFLTTELTSHDFVSVSVSCYGRVSYMVAETEDKDEVFIAFRGTSNFQDVMDGCSAWQQLASSGPDGRQTAMGGRCHAGFRKLASTIPVDPFLKKYHGENNRIVLCGHSLGGAVSHIVALNMLVELKRRGLPTDNIMSIAFGAPFFGDEGLRSFVEKQNLSDCLLTVVNQKDPVPRLLRLAEAVHSAVSLISDKVRKFVKDAKPLLTPLLAMLSSFDIAGAAAVASTTDAILDKLPIAIDQLDKMMGQHNVPLDELNSIYRPVGWYMFITCHTAIRTKWMVTYVREEVKINSLISNSDSLTGEQIHEHKAVCYATAFYNTSIRQEYGKFLKKSDFVLVDTIADSLDIKIPREVSMATAFPLHIDRVTLVSVASQEGGNDCGKLSVRIDGENLDFFVPIENPFTGIPYDKTSRITVNYKSSKRVILECQLTDGLFDPFPTVTIRTHFEEIQHQTAKDEVKFIKSCTLGQLAVGRLKPELLIKATQRCLATVMMMPESIRREELAKNAMMTYLDKLDKSRRAVRNGSRLPELFNTVVETLDVPGGLERLRDDKLLPVVGEIVAEVGDHLELNYPKRWYHWVLGTLLGLTAVAGVVYTGGIVAAYIGAISICKTQGEAIAKGVAGLIAAGAGALGKAKFEKYFVDVEENYKGVLRVLLEELPPVDDENTEKTISDSALTDDVYGLECAVKTKYETLGFLDENIGTIIKSKPFKSSRGGKLANATEGSQKEALRRCQMTCDLFRIRQLLMKTCFVGLIGPQDAGKTTLIKTLWKIEEVKDIGFQQHTKSVVLYKARGTDRMVIVDFPGTTSVDTQVATLVNHCGGLASFFILVMPFTGDPSKINIDQLNKVKNFGCSFIVCINQCGRFPDAFKTKENTDKFQADFSEVLDVKPSDIFFTDFVSCTPEMRAVGLVGVDDVRRWIKDWLVRYDVFKKDESELSRAVNEQAA